MPPIKPRLPENPFDGQIILDKYGVQWRFSSEIECWTRLGSVENIPLASGDTTGLLSAILKMKLDTIPEKSGGFGILTRPLKRAMDGINEDGVIFGDIKLISDSIDISCVGVGQSASKCKICLESKSDPPGFNFQIKELFYDSLCINMRGTQGQSGVQGEKGPIGDPGTGDGSKGDKGPTGTSYTIPGTFSGINIIESDDIYDYAVIDLTLNSANGILDVVKSKVKTASPDTPANRIISRQILRDIQFTNDWNYTIINPSNDALPLDPPILYAPKNFGGSGVTECSAINLNRYIDDIVTKYKEKFDIEKLKYEKQLKDFILAKDADSREKIGTLAKELAECEWDRPLEFCLGIQPDNCKPCSKISPSIACSLFGSDYADPSRLTVENLGPYKVKANETVRIRWPDSSIGGGSSTLPRGAYVVTYAYGAIFDGTKYSVPITFRFRNYGGTWDEHVMPPPALPYDATDKKSVEDAYINGPLENKSLWVQFGSPVSRDQAGNVIGNCDGLSNTGEIEVRNTGTGDGVIILCAMRFDLMPPEHITTAAPTTIAPTTQPPTTTTTHPPTTTTTPPTTTTTVAPTTTTTTAPTTTRPPGVYQAGKYFISLKFLETFVDLRPAPEFLPLYAQDPSYDAYYGGWGSTISYEDMKKSICVAGFNVHGYTLFNTQHNTKTVSSVQLQNGSYYVQMFELTEQVVRDNAPINSLNVWIYGKANGSYIPANLQRLEYGFIYGGSPSFDSDHKLVNPGNKLPGTVAYTESKPPPTGW